MTTTRKPSTCIDCGRKLTSSTRTPDHTDLCTFCFDLAGWENTHSDYGHDMNNRDENCPFCTGEGMTPPAQKTGHDKGIAKSHTSHAGHDHPSTKAARAACRKAAAKA